MENLSSKTKATYPKYVTASERIKCIGTINGRFPDFGHHEEKEMGGLWLHPIKLLDGFWLRFNDKTVPKVDVWLIADEYEVFPWGNRFYYGSNLGHTRVNIKQEQFCPEEANGIVVTYEFINTSDEDKEIEFEFLARTDLRPVWFSDEAGVNKLGADEVTGESFPCVVKAKDQTWFTAIGGDLKPDRVKIGQQVGPENNHGDGVSVSLIYNYILKANETKIVKFFVSGSFESEQECLAEYKKLPNLCGEDTKTKKARYKKLLNTSKICTGDKKFDEAVNWTKINTDWLIVNAGKYGRALTAGIPEYIWWFGCDNSYSVQGLLAMGDFKLARDTLELVLSYSEKHNGNGQILHEVTTMGICANKGNTQETAHFIVALWLYFEWTGDFTLVERALPYLQKSVEWLKTQDEEGDGFPGGYGIIEIEGLNSKLLDTAVYTAIAYECYAKICKLKGIHSGDYAELGKKLRENINTLMWNEEEGLYCDCFLDGKGQLIQYNWIINTPMEMKIAEDDKAHKALENMDNEKFIGSDGMYLSGLYRNQMMTINTGVMAVAQVQYDYADRALELINKTLATLGKTSPGCIAEMSPDYGCFIQAWTIYTVMVPIVRHFFGIKPVFEKNGHEVIIDPCLPFEWKNVSIKNVPVLDGEISISFSSLNGKLIYDIKSTVKLPVKFKLQEGITYQINGRAYTATKADTFAEISILD